MEDKIINDEFITDDPNFDSLCYGKGKPDDITVVALWITKK